MVIANHTCAQAQTQASAHDLPQHQSTPQHSFFAPAAQAHADVTSNWNDQVHSYSIIVLSYRTGTENLDDFVQE